MTADLIIANAAILTMDVAKPRAEALAIAGNKVIAVGTAAEMATLKGWKTRVIDAGGNTVTPGFVESHMHLFAGAAELSHLKLTGVRGFDELKARTLGYLKSNPGDGLVIGEQADYIIISEHETLNRHHLDSIVKDRPIMVYSPDHHTAWANSKALEMAGILRGRKLGPGNEIVMGGDGLAAGELREGEAMAPVRALETGGNRDRIGLTTGGEPEPYPGPQDFEHDMAVIRKGVAHCARHGITSIHNMDGNFYQLQLLNALQLRGELSARARVPFHFKNFMDISALDRAEAMTAGFQSDMLRSGFVKLFVDGVIDSATGVMVDDYSDRPGWKGEPLFTPEHFARVAAEADRRGLQIAVHAIGDGAVRIVLDGYEAARKANGVRDSRHRIEHIEVIHPDDIGRFKKLGVVASMQPPHPPGSQGLPLEPYLSRIGEKRWPYAFAWNTLRAAGAHVVFATDWPVSDINPLRSIHSAMTRKAWKAGMDDHRQTLDQSIRSYTFEGAYSEFAEAQKGVLKPGMLADIAVLDANLEMIDPNAIETVMPAATICDGRVVFER